MNLSVKYFLCLCWVLALYTSGMLVFMRGFLLKRQVVEQNSTCVQRLTSGSDSALGLGYSGGVDTGCWMPARYKKAVVIVIDALRFDFAAFNESASAEDLLPFQNNMKTVHELIKNKPGNAKLYKFLADPPTTTLQRLKGLTTGSLPTFIDAGANFDSAQITEDNFLHQLKNAGKEIVFMGDDTWISLYPNVFKRTFPFPSFDVKDLHTVDNGVLKYLLPELQKPDWDVLIAHFLGVDHCGHRYGPYHEAMTEKLVQMDDMIRSVVKTMDDDTILFVLGDHGMTSTGDHGGDSVDELNAALFVYSQDTLVKQVLQEESYKDVAQIDFVPTLSLLLGTPIPFSNLGTIITDLFTVNTPQYDSQWANVDAVRLNAFQVRNYIDVYAAQWDEFPHLEMDRLVALFDSSESQLQQVATQEPLSMEDNTNLQLLSNYRDFLDGVKHMCQDIWAKFDVDIIVEGVCLVLLALCLSVYWYTSLDYSSTVKTPWFCVNAFPFGFGASFLFALLMHVVSVYTGDISSCLIILLAILIVTVFGGVTSVNLAFRKNTSFHRDPTGVISLKTTDSDVSSLFSLCLMMLQFFCLFSNSYIVHEDVIIPFLLCSSLVLRLYSILKETPKSAPNRNNQVPGLSRKAPVSPPVKFDIGRLMTSPCFLALYLGVALLLGLRVASVFYACREEQWPCQASGLLTPLDSVADNMAQYKNIRYFLSVACVVAFPLCARWCMRHYGNLNGYSPCVLCVRYVLPLCALSLAFYWALQSLPRKLFDHLPVWQVVLFPRLLYICVLVLVFCVVVWPLSIYVVSQSGKKGSTLPVMKTTNDTVIPKLYNHVRMNWREFLRSPRAGTTQAGGQSDGAGEPPLVYGLGTVYSASHLVLLLAVAVYLLLLLGDGLAPSLTLYVASMALLLELFSSHGRPTPSEGFEVPWSSVLAWNLLVWQYFFATGHQATVTAIRWESAFHGFSGDWQSYVLPVVFVASNTFASSLLGGVALPLLLYWPLARGRWIHRFEKAEAESAGQRDQKAEFSLHEDPSSFRRALFRLFLASVLNNGVRLMATMLCAAIQRRHLMVWKIFAPRFIYEGASFLVTAVTTLTTFLFVVRVDHVLSRWTETLTR